MELNDAPAGMAGIEGGGDTQLQSERLTISCLRMCEGGGGQTHSPFESQE